MIFETVISSCHICFSQRMDGDMTDEKKMAQTFQLDGRSLFVPHLLHTSQVIQVPSQKELQCDAILTTDHSIALGIRVADCLPIILSAPGVGIAVIHGGWRSLLDGVVEKATQSLLHLTHMNPAKMEAWIGPSIQRCCNRMETKPVQWSHQNRKQFISQEDDGYHVDLQGFVTQTLENSGIKKSKIFNTHQCTYHQKEEYYSYRRQTQEKDQTGPIPHLGVVAWIER